MLMYSLLTLLPLAWTVLGDEICIDYPRSKQLEEIQGCPTTHVVDIRGTGEPQGPGAQSCIINELVQRLPQTDACHLKYKAEGGVLRPGEYARSEDGGVNQLNRHLIAYKKACPETGIVLMGYSQGAHVIGDSLCGRPRNGVNFKKRGPLDPQFFDNVKAIVQFGDPSNLNVSKMPENLHVGTGKGPGIFDNFRDFTPCEYMHKRNVWRSFCSEHDIFCDGSPPKRLCPHLEYLRYYGDDVLRYVIRKVTGKPPGKIQTKCQCPNFEKHPCPDCKNKTIKAEFEIERPGSSEQIPLEL